METSAQATSTVITITPLTIALAEGERYAGPILDATGKTTHHLILLPQQPDARLTWDNAIAWAKERGAELPTRQEQSLLYANCKDAFDPDWYWSGEQYAGHSDYAWGQDFDDGGQNYGDVKGYQGRVRAVRRFLID